MPPLFEELTEVFRGALEDGVDNPRVFARIALSVMARRSKGLTAGQALRELNHSYMSDIHAACQRKAT